MIGSFGESTYNHKANVTEAEGDQSNLLNNIVEFNDKSKTRSKEGNDKKRHTYESAYALYEGWELTLNVFKGGIFPRKAKQSEGLKILTPKQMLQRLPIVLAQVKAGNTSENTVNEIHLIIYSLYQEKEITKNV